MFRKLLILLAVACWSVAPVNAAMVWSDCLYVEGVSDFRSFDSWIYFAVSPAPAACSAWGANGPIGIGLGVLGVSAEMQEGALSLATVAQVTGQRVMFYYENSESYCPARIIALNGYSGQCDD